MIHDPLLFALGAVVWLVVTIDFLATTVSLAGQGSATQAIARGVWRVSRSLLRRVPDERAGAARAALGPAVLIAVASFWILGAWLAWSLIFLSGAESFALRENGAPLGVVDMIAFAGNKLSTAGDASAGPETQLWSLLAVVASINGMILLTLSVTYLLSLSGVVLSARATAFEIHHAWADADRLARRRAAAEILPGFRKLALELRAYPLACYFSSQDARTHVPSAVLKTAVLLARPEGAANGQAAAIEALRESAIMLVGGMARHDRPELLAFAAERWFREHSVGRLPAWWRAEPERESQAEPQGRRLSTRGKL